MVSCNLTVFRVQDDPEMQVLQQAVTVCQAQGISLRRPKQPATLRLAPGRTSGDFSGQSCPGDCFRHVRNAGGVTSFMSSGVC